MPTGDAEFVELVLHKLLYLCDKLMQLLLVAVSSGSITINDDSSVQILAEEACVVDQLDAQVCCGHGCINVDSLRNLRINLGQLRIKMSNLFARCESIVTDVM